MIRGPIFLFRKDIELLTKLEFNRIADLTFVEVKEELYKNTLPWDIEGKAFSLENEEISLGGHSFAVQRSCSFHVSKEKDSLDKTISKYRKLTLKVQLQTKSCNETYKYILFVQKSMRLSN